jgi:biotin carboxyl carrier protein
MAQPIETSSAGAGPAEAPRRPASPPPPPARNRGGWRKWRARFIVALLLAAAVLVFIRISADRAAESNRVSLDEVTLTAQAIPVEPTLAGRVTNVSVAALQQVTAGQRVGTVEIAGFDRDGDPKVTKVNLTAPRAGVVIDVPAPVGSTVQPGQPFLQLYDPAQMTFIAEVPVEDLPVIAPTMTAVLRTEGVNRPVHATVQRVVPRVQGARNAFVPEQQNGEDDSDQPDTLQVALVPATARDAQGLVPGMLFTGYINTVSGRPGTPRLVSLPYGGHAHAVRGGE